MPALRAHKTPYVRFDLNDYSVPHTHVRRTLEVLATVETVRILDGSMIIAAAPEELRPRRADRGARPHQDARGPQTRAGRAHRATDRLHYAAPSAVPLLQLAAVRGVHLGEASPNCSIPTALQPSRRPSPPLSPRTPCTSPPCPTSSICTAPSAGHPRPSP